MRVVNMPGPKSFLTPTEVPDWTLSGGRDKAHDTRDQVYVVLARAVDDYIMRVGLSIDHASRVNLIKAVANAYKCAGEVLTRQAAAMATFRADSDPPKDVARPPASSNPASSSLKNLFGDWAREIKPNAKTMYAWGRLLNSFSEFVRTDDVHAISEDDVIRWKDHLVAQGQRPKTIRDGKLAPLRAVLQWGVKNRRLDRNVAAGVTIDVRPKAGEKKRSYNDHEAETVLTAALGESGLLRWAPWLCAYSGARISEISQLRSEDVLEIKGHWCIRFTSEAGSLKNVHSERIVPLHSAIVAMGFVEFARSVAKGPIFPDIPPDRFGNRGGNATKIISKWVRKLHIADSRISPSHSWRHRFKTLARQHDLALDIVNALCGYRRGTVADSYGEFPLESLHREIEKLPIIRPQESQ
jgi:integrase